MALNADCLKLNTNQCFISFSSVELLEKCKYLGLITNKPTFHINKLPRTTISIIDKDYFYNNVIECDFKISNKVKGVYMIADLYIGATRGLENRIKQHFRTALNNEHCNRWFNKRLIQYLMDGKKIKIQLLSKDVKDENKFIDMYGGYESNLCNIVSHYPK